jgi:hypothetical protein
MELSYCSLFSAFRHLSSVFFILCPDFCILTLIARYASRFTIDVSRFTNSSIEYPVSSIELATSVPK